MIMPSIGEQCKAVLLKKKKVVGEFVNNQKLIQGSNKM